MKKQYINPSLIVMEMDTRGCIMAGSTIEVTVQNEDFDGDTMTSLARENGGLWDDDEE